MATECKNCKANPVQDNRVSLARINPKGVDGEWICQDCLGLMELFEDKPHYVHSATCPNYCDYACNGQFGFDLAEQIKIHGAGV
jgi:hypothetical protein